MQGKVIRGSRGSYQKERRSLPSDRRGHEQEAQRRRAQGDHSLREAERARKRAETLARSGPGAQYLDHVVRSSVVKGHRAKRGKLVIGPVELMTAVVLDVAGMPLPKAPLERQAEERRVARIARIKEAQRKTPVAHPQESAAIKIARDRKEKAQDARAYHRQVRGSGLSLARTLGLGTLALSAMLPLAGAQSYSQRDCTAYGEGRAITFGQTMDPTLGLLSGNSTLLGSSLAGVSSAPLTAASQSLAEIGGVFNATRDLAASRIGDIGSSAAVNATGTGVAGISSARDAVIVSRDLTQLKGSAASAALSGKKSECDAFGGMYSDVQTEVCAPVGSARTSFQSGYQLLTSASDELATRLYTNQTSLIQDFTDTWNGFVISVNGEFTGAINPRFKAFVDATPDLNSQLVLLGRQVDGMTEIWAGNPFEGRVGQGYQLQLLGSTQGTCRTTVRTAGRDQCIDAKTRVDSLDLELVTLSTQKTATLQHQRDFNSFLHYMTIISGTGTSVVFLFRILRDYLTGRKNKAQFLKAQRVATAAIEADGIRKNAVTTGRIQIDTVSRNIEFPVPDSASFFQAAAAATYTKEQFIKNLGIALRDSANTNHNLAQEVVSSAGCCGKGKLKKWNKIFSNRFWFTDKEIEFFAAQNQRTLTIYDINTQGQAIGAPKTHNLGQVINMTLGRFKLQVGPNARFDYYCRIN